MHELDNEVIKLFGVKSSGMYLVQDPVTGQYMLPNFGEETKENFRQRYLKHNPDEEDLFNRVWPALWALNSLNFIMGLAIIDTGVLPEHPAIKERLAKTLDYTGEGPEDQDGHGTICTILSRMSFIDGGTDPTIVSMKVVPKNGIAKPKYLLEALQDLPKLKDKVGIPVFDAHIRCGTFTRGYFGKTCDGTCEICKAAEAAANSGITLQVAVGNTPGKIACPAAAGVKRSVPGIIALSDGGKVLPGSPIDPT